MRGRHLAWEYDGMNHVMLHAIGCDNKATQFSHGIWGDEFFESYRNYYCGNSKSCDEAVEKGFMQVDSIGKYGKNYSVTKKGFEYLEELTGVEMRGGE